MAAYNVDQKTRVFSVTPAPSGQNTSKEIWEGFLNPQVDEIRVVDEKTNLLVGTIGGSAYYKFNELPKSYVAQTIPNSDILGDAIADNGLSLPRNSVPYIRLENGNIAYIYDYPYNSTRSGIFIYDAYDIQTTDPINGYWVAYKVNDNNPTLFEKIAEVKMTSDYYNNGWSFTYIPENNDNQCKFINTVYPNSDNTVLFSIVTTLNITKTGSVYTLTVSETTFDFGGATVLSLYNANAPAPIAPGVAPWISRNPYYSLQNYYTAIMNGKDEGWFWYGDGNSNATLITYQAGYNVLTGETAYIEPIISLATTTNFNPVGVIDSTYFGSSSGWQNPPSGVVFAVYNQQSINNQNNTNGVTAYYSPRWENNKLVTFLNQRNSNIGTFNSIFGGIFSNTNFIDYRYGFDSKYVYLMGINAPSSGFTIIISRFELDTTIKKQELQNLPIATSSANVGFINYWDIENGILCQVYDPDYNSGFGSNNQFARYYFNYWINTSSKVNRIQSNSYDPTNIIDEKIYSSANGLIYNTYNLGIHYDSYSSIYTTLNS